MPIILTRENLSQAVQAIASLAKPNSFHPVASMAFLSFAPETGLTIKATDMDNWLSMSMPVDGETTDASIQVDAAKLNDLVGKLSGDTIKLDMAAGYLLLSSGKGSKRKLAGVASTYPELPAVEGEAVSVEVDDLRGAVEFCAPSICGPDRPTFNGVRLEAGHAVAYNGAGFAAATLDAAIRPVTLRTGTLKLLKWLPTGDNVDITVGERMIEFAWDGGTIAAKMGEGAWGFMSRGIDAILPEHENHLIAHPAAIAGAINAVSAVAQYDNESKSAVATLRLSGSGCAVIVASQAGSGEQDMDAEWDGPDLEINLAAGRLRQILSGFKQDADVTIGITSLEADGPPKGCVFRQDAMPGVVGMLAQRK